MGSLLVKGGKKLHGSLKVNGSKNAALPLITAALLTPEELTLQNIPKISDVQNLLTILEVIGVDIKQRGKTITLQAKKINTNNIPKERVGLLRGSVLLMGPLLARKGQVRLPKPGGDIIGSRPIDTHLDAFCQLGVRVKEVGEEVVLDAAMVKPGEITLSEFSVTATENIMLMAAKLPGKTVINIAASEPHVVALAECLNKMGANISGAGTSTITVEGKKVLRGCKYRNIEDMLEAGLFVLLAAATKSSLVIERAPLKDMLLFFKKLDDIGVNYEINKANGSIKVEESKMRGFKLQTLPYPGIPTDMQAPFSVVATQAMGSSLIHDPMYEDRFKHIGELKKMGAKAVVCDPHRVIIEGPTKLSGGETSSLDIRSGATMIMAALAARGKTVIKDAEIIDRGYADLVARLRGVGADIDFLEHGNNT